MATELNEELQDDELHDDAENEEHGDEGDGDGESSGGAEADASLKADDGAGEAEVDARSEEEKAEERRQRRREMKQRRKEYFDKIKRDAEALRAQNEELNHRLAVIERKSTGSEMAQLQAAERQISQAYNQLKQINQRAIEAADGAAATEAQERMFQLRQRMEQLQNVKQAFAQRQNAPQPLDPRLISHAESWMSKNKWYDPSGNDEDSAVMLALDNRLAQEGWNPTSPQYWQELDKRAAKFLPHRFGKSYNQSQSGNSPRVPVAGSGRDGGGGNSGTTYRLSAERVQGLKDAGLWDDPKARAEAIKRYQEFDREQRK